MCTRVRAQTLQHERQGKTLDYDPIEYLTSNTCIICAGCCSMLCNCAEGLHFSAFHYISTTATVLVWPGSHNACTVEKYAWEKTIIFAQRRDGGGHVTLNSLHHCMLTALQALLDPEARLIFKHSTRSDS